MEIEAVELQSACLVNHKLVGVCFSDGTETFFRVDELLAYKPKRHLVTEECPNIAELLRA